MPSMSTSHGGVLYYVVKVPREEPTERWTATHRQLEEKQMVTSVEPLLNERRLSTDSGWDNPFRPDGDLSREADQIVELIKGGKPITPTPGLTGNDSKLPSGEEKNGSASPLKNGSAPSEKKIVPASGVEVQRGNVGTPGDVEHIVIKKKPMCKCCVIL